MMMVVTTRGVVDTFQLLDWQLVYLRKPVTRDKGLAIPMGVQKPCQSLLLPRALCALRDATISRPMVLLACTGKEAVGWRPVVSACQQMDDTSLEWEGKREGGRERETHSPVPLLLVHTEILQLVFQCHLVAGFCEAEGVTELPEAHVREVGAGVEGRCVSIIGGWEQIPNEAIRHHRLAIWVHWGGAATQHSVTFLPDVVPDLGHVCLFAAVTVSQVFSIL
ncbi:hypothetical protein EDB85DRAFT_1893554 [Lactarius pseudohatsudake]|nr:hypothetical protein EDB85DRAFT_1893554 [Lactarius pseudohatsudake]